MLKPSEQFDQLCLRIYTFGGLAFCLRLLPITKMQIANTDIDLAQKPVAVGMLTLLTIMLVVSAATCLGRDVIQDFQAITHDDPADLRDQAKIPWAKKTATTAAEKWGGLYFILDLLTFIITSVIPIVFGLAVFFYGLADIPVFFSYLVKQW